MSMDRNVECNIFCPAADACLAAGNVNIYPYKCPRFITLSAETRWCWLQSPLKLDFRSTSVSAAYDPYNEYINDIIIPCPYAIGKFLIEDPAYLLLHLKRLSRMNAFL
jgi:hypothetical protein